MSASKRRLLFFKNFFKDFYANQSEKVKKKIVWTLRLIEELEHIPETYFKLLTGSEGIYEIRVIHQGNIYRVLCFFDKGNIVVIGNGFQKKSQKTPHQEIERAHQIKRAYYEEKKSNNVK